MRLCVCRLSVASSAGGAHGTDRRTRPPGADSQGVDRLSEADTGHAWRALPCREHCAWSRGCSSCPHSRQVLRVRPDILAYNARARDTTPTVGWEPYCSDSRGCGIGRSMRATDA